MRNSFLILLFMLVACVAGLILNEKGFLSAHNLGTFVGIVLAGSILLQAWNAYRDGQSKLRRKSQLANKDESK